MFHNTSSLRRSQAQRHGAVAAHHQAECLGWTRVAGISYGNHWKNGGLMGF